MFTQQHMFIYTSYLLLINSVASLSDDITSNVKRILKYELEKDTPKPYDKLKQFIAAHPYRLTGSKQLEKAITYVEAQMSQIRGVDVHTEEVIVPKWVRRTHENYLSAKINGIWETIPIKAIGGTVPTAGRLQARGVVVKSFHNLHQLGQQGRLQGKIVIYNQKWITYESSYVYRVNGSAEAAKYGAVAAITRSVAPYCDDSIHTGRLDYNSDIHKIPACTISCPDATKLEKQFKSNNRTLELRLLIRSYTSGDGISRNLIAEIRGSTNPKEVVLLSCHIDSWDVGTGAYDDGTGIAMNWHVLDVLSRLNIKPKRTLRAVFFTGEEQGYVGSRDYYRLHNYSSTGERIVFAAETDTGGFSPSGLNYTGPNEVRPILQQILELAKPLNPDLKLFNASYAGDITPWLKDGVPSIWYENRNKHHEYFKYHHSEHDVIENIDPGEINNASVLWTIMAYAVADDVSY